MQFEVERKFWVSDFSPIKMKLERFDVQLFEQREQIDQYFSHPSRDFSQTDEALRLRQECGRNFITYKGARIDSETKTRQELDLDLGSRQDVPHQFCDLLTLLGFEPVMTVRKLRQKGKIVFQDTPFEICLDEIDQLGSFVEIETTSDAMNLDRAQSLLKTLAEELSLERSERRSYLELLMHQLAPHRE